MKSCRVDRIRFPSGEPDGTFEGAESRVDRSRLGSVAQFGEDVVDSRMFVDVLRRDRRGPDQLFDRGGIVGELTGR